MKYGYTFALIFSLLLISCSEEKTETVPDDVLPKKKMIQILVHTHILESTIGLDVKYDTSFAKYQYYEKELLKDFGVDYQLFKKSKAYYEARPELMYEIYEAVVDSLNIKERKKQIR